MTRTSITRFLAILGCFVIVCAFGAGIQDMQTIDGAQRNKLQDIINASGSGSGSVSTNRNIFTTSPLTGGGNLSADLTLVFDGTAAFVASGATGLNATQLTLGTIPTARYGLEVVTTGLTLTATSPITGGGNLSASRSFGFDGTAAFVASGATTLNASNLSSGTVPDARLSSAFVQTNRSITTSGPLSGGGNLSADRALTYDGSVTHNESGATNLNASSLASGTVPDARISSAFVQTNVIPFSFNLPNQTVIGLSNSVTFAHRVVPNGMTQTVSYVDMLLIGGTSPGVNQIVRVFDATASATLLATNSTWRGTLTITNGTRWYARFENNSATNISVSASVNGFTR